MEHSISKVSFIVSLTAYVLMVSAQIPTDLNNPFFLYPNYNFPPALPAQKIAANELLSKQFSGYDDHSIQNTLGSHVVLLTTCLGELKSTKADLSATKSKIENLNAELKGSTQNFTDTIAKVETLGEEFKVTKQQLGDTLDLLKQTNKTVENLRQELSENSKGLALANTKIQELTLELKTSTTASSIGKIPASCGDLRQIGHKKSGLYSIMGSKQVESVYCDFTKETSDAGSQKWIGFADVKSTPVYFHALRHTAFDQTNVPIPYEKEQLNIGGGMNLSTGKFTAPVKGVYFFSFAGLAGFPSSTGQNVHLKIAFYLNGSYLSTAEVAEANTVGHTAELIVQSTLSMQKGDQIWLQIWSITPGVKLWDYKDFHHTHFTGFLLHQEMSVSL